MIYLCEIKIKSLEQKAFCRFIGGNKDHKYSLLSWKKKNSSRQGHKWPTWHKCTCWSWRAPTVKDDKVPFFFFLEGGIKWVIYHGLLFNFNFNGKRITNLLVHEHICDFPHPQRDWLLGYNSTYLPTCVTLEFKGVHLFVFAYPRFFFCLLYSEAWKGVLEPTSILQF